MKKKKNNSVHEYKVTDNPAKSYAKGSHKYKTVKNEENRISKGIGIALAVIQLLASILLIASLFVLDMLSFK